jgi:two-component system sensor histidine kinase TorS
VVFARLGIGARLFIAFVGITAVSLSSGVASWVVLREISEAQSRLITQALPAVSAMQRTAEATAKLVAAAPALTAATDESTRRSQDALLSSLADEIRRSVAEAGPDPLTGTDGADLERTIEALISNLSAQNALVRERIALDQAFGGRAVRTIQAATEIVDLSETLVSNASAGTSAVIANLYGLVEDERHRDEAYDALDRLIEQDIYLLGGMFELRLRSSQIGLLANQLTRAVTEAEVAAIATAFADHLRVIRRRVASIDDPVRREQAGEFLAVLVAATGASPWDDSLFSQRRRLISIGAELDRVAAANSGLATEVSRAAQAMLAASEGFARSTAEQAGAAVGTGFYSLVISSLVAIMISGLIVWFYVERRVVRRLGSLAEAMRRLTDGDLAVDVADEGTHELKAMSKAVRAFRDESKQRRALEIERERTNEELRRHREELQVLVDERTRQLQDANAKLQQEVANHAAAREKAEIANRAKSDFLATMSHEIRTPMTGMLGMLRILNSERLNPAQRRRLDVATSSGEALLGILNSILDYSKIESGSIAVEPLRFNLKDTLAGVVELMRPSAAEKDLKLAFSCDRSVFGDHVGDAGKLRQIVFNLVSNAIKFTERGGVSVAVRRTGATAAGDRLAIVVADTGIGIAPGDLGRIFEPFTQTDASITRRFGGTGLGLAISRRLAEVMGGELTVQSTVGEGSCFTLSVTLARAAAAPDVAGQTAQRPGRGPALRILAVEDDAATRIVVQTFLENMGHEVLLAVDGYRAIELAARERPDLVLIDVSMPGMDGLEAARRIRAIAGLERLPILAMSAHVYKDEVASYLQAGMDGFVGKPLTPEALARALEEVGVARAAAAGEDARGAALDRRALDADLASLGRATVTRILDAAERALPAHFAALRSALGEGDLAAVAEIGHAIRSAAGAAGFAALHAAAHDLERAARSGDGAAARRQLAACEALYPPALAAARSAVAASA